MHNVVEIIHIRSVVQFQLLEPCLVPASNVKYIFCCANKSQNQAIIVS